MKTLTAKQETRLEKKKKKMAALAEIIKLNDKDRKSTKNPRSSSESSNSSSTDRKDFLISSNSASTSTNAMTNSGCAEGPKNKRMKIESIGDCRDPDEPALTKNTKAVNNVLVKTYGDKIDEEQQLAPLRKDDIACANLNLTEDQYIQLKRELNERKRSLRNVPRLRLKELGDFASLSNEVDSRTPIFLTDIQHLLMVALFGSGAPCTPLRWCHLEKGSRLSHTLVVIVEGLSLFHFLSYESNFVETNRIFQHKLEVIMPLHKEGNIIEELAAVPLTNTQQEELIERHGSLEAAIEVQKDPMLMVKTMFPVENQSETPQVHAIPNCDKFARTQLLLSALQMVDEGYPLPLRGKLATRYSNYRFTKDTYAEVTANSPMFGLDCEMCKTTSGVNELTRISIVDETLKPVYETLVRPSNQIVDYLTPYSGITPEMMLRATKNVGEVHKEVSDILPMDAILVGQSLNSDLHAMKMMHPYVIDTSVIFNLTGEKRRKSKLQTLAKEFLGERIQDSIVGHDSIEDSQTSLKLTKLKLSKGLEFGDAILGGRKKANEIQKTTQQKQITIGDQTKEVISHNLFAHIAKNERRTAIITSDEVNIDFQKVFNNEANVYAEDDTIRNENMKTAATTLRNGKPTSIDCFRTEGNKGAIRKTRDVSSNYALTITNLNVAPQRLELSRIEKTISNVDKWISRLWETVEANGLFIVLLGGTPCSSSGVAMIKIKKSVADVATDTPVTL